MMKTQITQLSEPGQLKTLR